MSSAIASFSTSAIFADGGTFISARTERTPETRSISQCISARGIVVRAAGPQVRPRRHRSASDARGAVRRARPQFFRDERHEGMQQLPECWSRTQAAVARVSALAVFVRAVQHRLDEFEIPVAEDIPDEVIGGARRFVEAQGFQMRP